MGLTAGMKILNGRTASDVFLSRSKLEVVQKLDRRHRQGNENIIRFADLEDFFLWRFFVEDRRGDAVRG